MARLTSVDYVSLDGAMQSPGCPDEDTRDGFTRGGWASAWLVDDPVAAQASMEGQGTTAALLFGRRTYLDLVGHWLSTTEPNPFTQILTDTPKYVASRTLEEPLPHPRSTLLRDDTVAAVAELKHEVSQGDLVLLGSGVLVRDLAAAGLVDDYLLTIIPVVLGAGHRLFGDTYAAMRVTRSVTSPSGAVMATYEVVHPDR